MAQPSARVGSDPSADGLPPIGTLPAELFLEILQQALDPKIPPYFQLHKLARVSKYWQQSINSNSRFWRIIDHANVDLVPVVLKRNPNGPLAIRCCNLKRKWSVNFWEAARGQAHRWDSLELSGDLTEQHMQLFDHPTPALVSFNILTYRDSRVIFPLSDTSALRHVQVWGIRLPWESPSLAGLRSIFIHGSDPSLRHVVNFLSASPALEWLALRDITGPGPTNKDVTGVEDRTISLPALRGLYLMHILSTAINNYLLKNINGSNCRILEATIPFPLIQRPGPNFRELVSTSISATNRLNVGYYGSHVALNIHSPILLNKTYPGGWRQDGDEMRARITIKDIPNNTGALQSIIDVLGLRVLQTDVTVRIHSGNPGAESALRDGDLHVLLDSTTRLYFNSQYGAARLISDLHFLANPVIENGHGWWRCPRLIRLEIEDQNEVVVQEVANATVEFLKNRSTARKDVDVTWEMPLPLQYLEADEETIDLIRAAKAGGGVSLRPQ